MVLCMIDHENGLRLFSSLPTLVLEINEREWIGSHLLQLNEWGRVRTCIMLRKRLLNLGKITLCNG